MEIVKSVLDGKFSDLGDFIKSKVISRIDERIASEKSSYLNSLKGITEDKDPDYTSIQFDNYSIAKKVANKLKKFGAWAKEGDGCVYFKDLESQKDAIAFLSDKYGFSADDPNGLNLGEDKTDDEKDGKKKDK